MASVYGGTLLVGAQGGSQLAQYVELTEADANEACEAYQTAAKDRCVPVPLLTVEKIPHGSGFVVAVNVLPILDRPVAVKVTTIPEDRFGSPPRAYIFPVRLSTHAVPYTPESLPMLLNPAIRRVAILLESIPQPAREKVRFIWVAWYDDKQRPHMSQAELLVDGVDLEGNVLRVLAGGSERIPLDDVQAIWEHQPGRWTVRVAGAFDPNKGYQYESRPA
jgi:hypothetical protein